MLRVSDNRRYLAQTDGSPFFYLGDTAWELFHRLDRDDASFYLRNRAAKGFNVIQAVAISEFDGLIDPNPYGDLPLIDGDATRPNDAYFRHVDFVVAEAASMGLVVGLLPTWADKVGPVRWGSGPEIFNPENARVYGEYLGRRFRDAPLIWILGGDRTPATEDQLATWRAMAEGLADGDGGAHLRTFHPQGNSSSSASVHDESWLDFNMIQSGHHQRDKANTEMIAADYVRVPTKPCLDGEPCYEDHPVDWKPELGSFDDWDARKAAYRALFAGACGHTYGANSIFQFWTGGDPGKFSASRPWQEALELPGASQMRHARDLLLSRPFFTRIPDQSLIVADPGPEYPDRAVASRAADGTYAFIYLPSGGDVTLDPSTLLGPIDAHWYDPRTGARHPRFDPPDPGGAFTSPTQGPNRDWVLVLDRRDAD